MDYIKIVGYFRLSQTEKDDIFKIINSFFQFRRKMFQQLLKMTRLCGYDMKQVKGKYKHVHLLELRKNFPTSYDRRRETATIEIPDSSTQDDVDKLYTVLSELKENFQHQPILDVSKKLRIGSIPPKNLGNVISFLGQGQRKRIPIVRQQGRHLVLFLWASWCGPCIKPLQDLHDTLEINKNFLDKATFWSICLDDDVNEIAGKIYGSRWETYIKHFLLEDTDYEHELIKAFQISGLPYYVVIDKHGKVHYSGSAIDVDAAKMVREILRFADPEPPRPPKDDKPSLTIKEAEHLIGTLSNHKFLEKQFKEISYLHTKIIIQCQYILGKEKVTADFQVYMYDREKQYFEPLYRKFLKNQKLIDLKMIEVKTINVPPVTSQSFCLKCGDSLQYPFYWCRWDDVMDDAIEEEKALLLAGNQKEEKQKKQKEENEKKQDDKKKEGEMEGENEEKLNKEEAQKKKLGIDKFPDEEGDDQEDDDENSNESNKPGVFWCRKCMETKPPPQLVQVPVKQPEQPLPGEEKKQEQQQMETKEIQKDYPYQKNSVLLVEPVQFLPEINLGKNLQPLEDDAKKNWNFICNACDKCPTDEHARGEARFVCIYCRSEPNYYEDYIDICYQCMCKYLNHEEGIDKKVHRYGHEAKHPFTRVLYHTQNYKHF